MQIIPVIDILNSQVVHAHMGSRDSYHPVSSCLTRQTAPDEIIAAFLEIYTFETVYIADLDAIQKKGDNRSLITDILECYSDITFWVDSGVDSNNHFNMDLSIQNLKPVYGTENKLAYSDYVDLYRRHPDMILSLDFFSPEINENIEFLNDPDNWPENVIIMSLYKVGSDSGPDYDNLGIIIRKAANKHFYAAGGIRDVRDLQRLKTLGMKGVLIASALHNGVLDKSSLSSFAKKNTPDCGVF